MHSPQRDRQTGRRSVAPPIGFWSLVWQGVVLGVSIVLGLGLLAICAALIVYAYYASMLPSPDELYARTTQFQTVKIYDRSGSLLHEFIDPHGGRRVVTHYEDIPSVVIEATIATEDATFFANAGIEPVAILRGVILGLQQGQIVSGGSTITQQVVKNHFLSSERTLSRKIKEAILATELTRRYAKSEIIEVYLNDAYFGNLAYGIGAAAELYYGKDVPDLDLHEAALLVGLIQAPVKYDPYTRSEEALARRQVVLNLMAKRGYITSQEAESAQALPLDVIAPSASIEAPHVVMYVWEQIQEVFAQQVLYTEGLRVYTTIDPDVQALAEDSILDGIKSLQGREAHNAALVALDPATGDILAMVGSADFWNEPISGQINMALSPRQPGSTIKTLTYLAALERGWTAATMVMDVEQTFPDGANPPYKPVNYDGETWGPISVRTALACSRNIPAVSVLNQIGLEALMGTCERLGIHSLTRSDYGLSLTLGGGEVSLLEMTAAYAALASGGHLVTPRAILFVEDGEGRTLFSADPSECPLIMDPRHAYILTNILDDDQARIPAFGPDNPLQLGFPSAAKTGTTNDFRDAWTIGYTPNLVTGVWVGNCDNRPMDHVTGVGGASPIWHRFMADAPLNADGTPFDRPEGLVDVEVCPISGQLRTEDCPPGRTEIFMAENAPSATCSVHVRRSVCVVSGKLASAECPPEMVEERVFEDYGPGWDAWAQGQGRETPPRERCDMHVGP